ncbi:phospholipid-transporting ATPase ABCA1 [Callorhinchus milii]|nr:phospholipid-transporting ATPase ABCA1 [Callorhinchus milii]|eukprot:gi/632978998/ref/XP_007906223.1/ PREDICTED: ATP-binding cassette sub-family A member 1-like [Callorhinchus milii]
MGLLVQLRLLLWKNVILRKRQKIRLIIEFLWPLFLFFILVWVRSTSLPINKGQCHYRNKALPSAGVLPWMQGIICNMNNPCLNYPTPGEAPGQVNNFDTSLLSAVLADLQDIDANPSDQEQLNKFLKDLNPRINILDNLKEEQDIWENNQALTAFLKNNLSLSDAVIANMKLARKQMDKITKLRTPKVLNTMLNNRRIENASDSLEQLFGSLAILFCGNVNISGNGQSESSNEGTNSEKTTSPSIKPAEMLPSDNSTSDFCKSVVETLQSTPSLNFLWNTIRHLLMGKIVFTPDTPVTRRIVQEANSTFQAIGILKELGDSWEAWISSFLENSTAVNQFRKLLTNPVFAGTIDRHLSGTGWNAKQLASFLYYKLPKSRQNSLPNFDQRDITDVIHMFTQFLGCINLDRFEAAPTEADLVNISFMLLEKKKFWAGIVFQGMDSEKDKVPPHVLYKIRMDIDDVENTEELEESPWYPGARDNSYNEMPYILGGFAYIQDMIDHGIMKTQLNISQPLGVYVQQMPYPCYVDDGFTQNVGSILPMFLILAFIFSVAMIIKGIVYEKEKCLKVMLNTMGLRNGVLWFAWFMDNIVILTISSAFLSVLLKYGNILRYSDPLILFIFLFIYCVATIMECFLISTFFSRANLAAACGAILYFLLYLPYVLCFAWQDYLTFPIKISISLLSTVAFSFGCENFSFYEVQGIGIQWSNINISAQEGNRFSFLVSMLMMLLDAFIYWLLVLYIEAVFPGQYGIPKPWYFLVTKSYWCGSSSQNKEELTFQGKQDEDNVFIEPQPHNLKLGISIQNLVKIYKTGKKIAVDGLSVNFYEGQITSFLGHNGAGKTTTMSILTGLFPPSSGTAFIYGSDIRTAIDSIRKDIGFCPQYNVLFDQLTVEEHIYFYACLKECSSKEVEEEIDRMINDVGLPNKRKDLVKNLSGGMQRKLSVAIAFVGGSKTVILDEPTAGVDPYARRGIWELLLKYKPGRTIILSTHHMDEADILGDRIAIISHGKLCCCGSSMFLKKFFGSGYYLTLVKSEAKRPAPRLEVAIPAGSEDDDVSDEGIGSDSGPNDLAGENAITGLIMKHVPEAQFVESIGQEMTYILPYEGAGDGSFAELFKNLDLELQRFGISSYGISDTTLEEIFLKVAEDTGVDTLMPGKNSFKKDWKRSSRELRQVTISNLDKNPGIMKANDDTDLETDASEGLTGRGSYTIDGKKLMCRQFFALFIKRFHHARRSQRGFLAQVVLPALFVCLALVFSLIIPPFVEFPSLELQPWMYGSAQHTFFSNDATENEQVAQVVDSMVNNPGFGTRCMNNDPIPKLPCMSNDMAWYIPPVPPSVNDTLMNGNWSMANPSPSCQCSTPEKIIMLPDCIPGAGGLPPIERLQNTTDILQNMTGRNVTDYLVKTYEEFYKIRYGGISVGEVNSQAEINKSIIAANLLQLSEMFNVSQSDKKLLQNAEILMEKLVVKDNVKVWFYNKGWHAMVSFINVASNAILRGNLQPGKDPRDYGITTYNHPLNLTKVQLTDATFSTTSADVVVSICVIFAMSFIPASFVLFLIQERVSKAKHLQLVSGVNPTIYWIANFAWDMCNYAVSCVMVVVIFLCFQQKSYVSSANLPVLILLFVLYGWSIIPLMYLASFLFSIPSTAYVVLTCINMFIGINGSIATFVLEIFENDNLTKINDVLKQLLLIFPHFCLGRGLIDMAKNQGIADAYARFGEDRFQSPFEWNLVGKNLFAMFVQGMVLFMFTILLEYTFFIRSRRDKVVPQSAVEEDEDVSRERMRILSGEAQSDLLTICELTKFYRRKKKPAVNKICLGIPPAQCFGLLGINGAGKTTTFKMLTGDISVTSGDAFLNGYSILTQIGEVHQNMGYCPQFDAINDLLNGREHLELYARLRGIPEEEVQKVAEWGIQKLGLIKYSSRSAGTYSGGNKRKLSTAIALIGCPPVVFLDEPTTGMDPKARRFLWNCILSIVKEGRSIVLTSHSMEECEALCNRMAIMVNGQFKCLGSIQHLKSRFGDGYTMSVRVGGDLLDLRSVEDFVQSSFPNSVLKEKHHNILQYQLPSSENSLAKIFSTFTNNKERLNIEDYTVSQTTLDQVFVNFAKDQIEIDEDAEMYTNSTAVTNEELKMEAVNFPHAKV